MAAGSCSVEESLFGGDVGEYLLTGLLFEAALRQKYLARIFVFWYSQFFRTRRRERTTKFARCVLSASNCRSIESSKNEEKKSG
jgi:hypothetical protein